MHLIQILLPVYDNAGRRLPAKLHDEVKQELMERFKGLTAYGRAPAEGLWKKGGSTRHDDIVVYEVMVKKPGIKWWAHYRGKLEKRFAQHTVIIRSQKMKLL